MPRKLVFATAMAVVVGASAVCAGAQTVITCKERKTKATGRRTFDTMKALSTSAKRPDASRLVRNLSKAESKFTKAISKAERRGACLTSGDTAELEVVINRSVIETITEFDGDVIIWTSQPTEHPYLGGPEDLEPTEACDYPWALVEVSWPMQQLGSTCRYFYDATWVCLDPLGSETKQKSGDRSPPCLTVGSEG